MNAASWLTDLQSRVLSHSVIHHPMLQAFAEKRVTWQQARVFGLAYYPHMLRTRLYQASALSISLDEDVQFALASILHDEYGQGDPAETHPAVYRRFLRGLGYAEKDWADPPILLALDAYIMVHRTLCSADPIAAAGVAGLAMEWPIPSMYRQVLEGLQTFPVLTARNLQIFSDHIHLDEAYGAQMSEALVPLLGTDDARRRLEEAVFASLDARSMLMDGIWTEMLRASKPWERPIRRATA